MMKNHPLKKNFSLANQGAPKKEKSKEFDDLFSDDGGDDDGLPF